MKTKTITKENIMTHSMHLLKEEGANFLNARSIARKMQCSTQPIYLAFSNMDELKKELLHECKNKLQEYIQKYMVQESSLFMGYLISYIQFAYEYPKLFEYIYMKNPDENTEQDQAFNKKIIEGIMTAGNYTYETAYRFFLQSFVYAHGFACQIVTGFVQWEMKDIRSLFLEEFEALKLIYKGDK